jgi:hypothetical protein
MGNATRPRSASSPKKNVEPMLNQIRRQMNNHRTEAIQLKKKFNNLGPKINSGSFNERDLVIMHLIPMRMQEIVQSQKALERMYQRLIRHQIEHGF